jgi:glycyl-tRNA synthetase beta chain
MSGDLLLEIGTEEIPSNYLNQALRDLEKLAAAALKEHRMGVSGNLAAFGTPRRLILFGEGIVERQEDAVQEVIGPPMKVSYDEQGKATKAAFGFAQKVGVAVDELSSTLTPRGEYLYVRQRVPGRSAEEILTEILPKLISEIPWPKSMRWGTLGFPFVRPIHWIVALFNGRVVPFETAGIKSGNISRGHRFMAPEPFEVSGIEEYRRELKGRFVLIDPAERRNAVESVVREACIQANGIPSDDPELITIVANLVEYPSAVCGSFGDDFLILPEKVLLTSMREHQRYFGVYNGARKLLPYFIAVNNTVARDESVVRKGHERVLRARLSDAVFFFKEDRKRTLADRMNDLKGVIYQAGLGSSYEKVRRFTRLAESIAETIFPEKLEFVRLAAGLCKCDLVTHMVAEFPSLQGVMGEEYARLEGYPEEVCRAIREHYLPEKSGGALPTAEIGALVGIADRVDTIAGCFSVGLEPTGAADPFGLRRHALAVIRILDDKEWDIDVNDLFREALILLGNEIEFDREPVLSKIQDFVRERYKQLMLRSGFESDFIEAVISVQFDRIHDVRLRIEGLKAFSLQSDEFRPLALTFKRITNILKKESVQWEPDPALMAEPCESTLWEAYRAVQGEIRPLLEKRDYPRALALLAGLRKPVDEYFDGVEIMTRDERVRKNRIGTLQHLCRLFLMVADLSKFAI